MPLTLLPLSSSAFGPLSGPAHAWKGKLCPLLRLFHALGPGVMADLVGVDGVAVADRARVAHHLRLPLGDYETRDAVHGRPRAALTAGVTWWASEDGRRLAYKVFCAGLSLPERAPAGIEVVAVLGEVALVRVTDDALEALAADCTAIALARPVTVLGAGAPATHPTGVPTPLDRLAPSGTEPPLRALLGIVDSRFDLLHPDLCWRVGYKQGWPEYLPGANGRMTKVRALWRGEGTSILKDADIDAALGEWTKRAQGQSTSFTAAWPQGHHPAHADGTIDDHGTMSAAVAAGRDHSTASVGPGRAPGAELLLASLDEAGGAPDTFDLVAAVHWMGQEAGDLPLVVNLSLATPFGPRDGSSLEVQALDHLAGPAGRAVVVAAGNDNLARRHVRQVPGPFDEDVTLAWEVAEGPLVDGAHPLRPTSPDALQVYARGARRVRAVLHVPTGEYSWTSVELPPNHRGGFLVHDQGMPVATVWWDNQGWRGRPHGARIEVCWVPHGGRSLPVGAWRLDLEPLGTFDDVQVDAWLGVNDQACTRWLRPAATVHEQTLSDLATGHRTIVVGNAAATAVQPCSVASPYNQGPLWLNSSSACGPTADGRAKPDYAAPGTLVQVPCAQARDSAVQPPAEQWRFATGTSVAAPSVAGLVALFMAANPGADLDAVRGWLDGQASTNGNLGLSLDPLGWGRGRVG